MKIDTDKSLKWFKTAPKEQTSVFMEEVMSHNKKVWQNEPKLPKEQN